MSATQLDHVIGIDFGTLSARGILLNVHTAEELAVATYVYPHGVIDQQLPTGEPLPAYFALQHPRDYIDALSHIIPKLLTMGNVDAATVKGVGIDFTACTVLPVDAEGVPLCMKDEFLHEPHAYVKLWKHHAAQPEADEINRLAQQRNEPWLSIYGGRISCEWMLPKLLETLRHAPHVYEHTVRYLEAADWLSQVLTGTETHSAPFAGYKGLWNAEAGYPSNDFFTALDARLDGVVGSRIGAEVSGMDQIAGYLNERGAKICGLKQGTALALPMIDAHAAMPALNVTDEGELMIILGTSACQILNTKRNLQVDGICGYVKDGVIPGYYTYEAGQAAVGDIFEWFVQNCVPASYTEQAAQRGIGIHALLREKAKKLAVGESGLVCLDWWNGNRSILVDSSLTGMITGLTLRSKPEDIYRALLEATAYGLRVIVEQYEAYGIPIKGICASGGIARKDDLMMQIYADVLNREISIAGVEQAGALGSAIYAAVAADLYPTIGDAAAKLSRPSLMTYTPMPEQVQAYQPLYRRYLALHDLFGTKKIAAQ